MAPLTILHTESSTGWGGQENRTLEECRQLRALGCRMLLACQPQATLARRAADDGFEVHTLPMRRSFDLRAMWRLARIARRAGVHVINTHSSRDTLLAGFGARLLRRRPLLVRTRHLILPVKSLTSYRTLPDHVVAVSRAVADYLVSVGLPPHRVTSIPTGVDVRRFDPAAHAPTLRGELGLTDDVPLIGTVAILRAKKGHRDLLQAVPAVLARHPGAMFVLAGDGPQRDNLQADIAAHGLSDRVRLLGLRRDVPEVLRSLDLFVLPTHQEALGTAFLEAQAMGVPVLGTRVGGVPETLREGVTGTLVPPHDPAALAGAINTLLDDRARLRAMADAARPWVCEHFDIAAMGARMLALYRQLLGGKAP